MPESNSHPDDIFHVIIDALTIQRDAIKAGNTPWKAYDSDPADDPKVTAEGYGELLDQAETFATNVLDRNVSLKVLSDALPAAINPT